jgi:SAM-dependent MidA family methyltransferase
VILANEVLDAMPVHRYCVAEASVEERGVCWHEASQAFHWQAKSLNPEEMSARPFIAQAQAQISPLTPSYCFEWNHLADGWLHSIADCLGQGAILLIDYGQEGRSYFHPSRTDGQIACYFQHTKDERPLEWPGLKDITSHVNFSQISQAGDAAGLTLSGFTTQANFLIGNDLGELWRHMPEETIDRFKLAQAIKKLTMPDEMGEDFKVIAFTKDLTIGLAGFQSKDLRHWL